MLPSCPGERWQQWGNDCKASRYTLKEDGLAYVKNRLGWLKPCESEAILVSQNGQAGQPLTPTPWRSSKVPKSSCESACAATASNLTFDMATLTIRQLDDKIKNKLRVRAAQHGHSMAEEAREILRSALRSSPVARENLTKAIRERFAPLGGVNLELPRRDPIRQTARSAE
jgi:plasmid stability protein